ncbi:MAG: DMT family transporter [Microbacterium sp.]|uniref:DMT family transporter n=1 Tax=Microbacterium sp. TaxID=51671 RepID=UPI0039E55035
MSVDRARRLPPWAALCVAGFIGCLLAVQSRINGQLGIRLDDGLVAALVSFGSGLAILLVLSAALPAGRRGVGRLVRGVRGRTIPWWMLCVGAAGALTVAAQGLVVGIIGVSLFTVGLVAGQTVSGLLLDRAGFGPGGAIAVTLPRVVSGALALAAAVVSFVGGGVASAPLWMLALPFVAGAAVGWQQAATGRLRQRVGAALTATLVNFAVGTAILAATAGASVATNGPPLPFPPEPWLYVGGALGVAFVFLAATLVVHTGVLLLALGAIAGQLIASVVLDALWPAASSPGLVFELVVVAVALSSVAVALAPSRRRRDDSVTSRG